ncbi:MAG: restriction endonuclease subunit S, partial [Gammaproteobacteria bacterium]|nr:restriction endonuclease subunit S [Gammaproteobacteria bacterium]
MKVKIILSTWLVREAHRFDCKPFMSGALEARVILKKLAVEKAPLHEVTKGYKGGIYNGPQFSRMYVDSPERGVPFVGSSSMLMADLSNLPFLLKTHAYSPRLSYLRLEEGMTLISCSGTIGRMVYVRPDMAGIWSSQDILKVVPDPGKIPPGYLYAYLSGKFGVPQVVSGTYGAIIQHIEPE